MIRDWLDCLAILRALGRTGRHDLADLWRLTSKWERKLLLAHLRSLIYAGYLERLRRRKFGEALGVDTEDLIANFPDSERPWPGDDKL